MGIAGVALLALLYFLYKFIRIASEHAVWKKKDLVFGTVGEELRRISSNVEKKYVFDFTLNTEPDETKATYEETVKGNEKPSVKPGDCLEVYYDPVFKQYRPKEKLTKELKWSLIGVVGSAAVLGICCVVMSLSS